ncbi:MAG: DUF3857 domain-containing protein [Saprospiraceae bacterium]|nr:DUF3857 domain-containing protein [Saprospiraceae bacterium]
MPYTKFLTLFWLLAITPLVAQNTSYSCDQIPPALLPFAHSVIRQSETVLKIKNDRTIVEEQRYAVTILDPMGKRESRLSIYENEFQKIRQLKGKVFDAGGTLLRESQKSDVKSFSASDVAEYSDGHWEILEMDHHSYPYTVEFTSRVEYDDFFWGDSYQLQKLGQSVEKASIQLVAPVGFQFKWKALNTQVQAFQHEEDKKHSWTWEFSELGALPSEPFTPYFNEELVQLAIIPEQIRMGEYQGVASTWRDLGRFFYDINTNRDILSPEMTATIQQMTAGKSDAEKVEILYRYLQQNHRYISIQIGIGGWQTLPAQFVEQKKYGDCKALSNYMKSMLKVAGIEAWQALVYAGEKGAPSLYNDIPYPRFNHVILYVPKQDMWLECTSTSNPTGYLGSFTSDRRVLLLTPDGGVLRQTPGMTAQDNVRYSNTDIVLYEQGNATIQNRVKALGEPHDVYREWISKKKQPEIERDFVEQAPFGIGKINRLQLTAQPKRPEAEARYSVETNNFATRSGKRMFVPVNKANPLRRTLPDDEMRLTRLSLPDAFTWQDTLHFTLPAGFVLENAPPAQEIFADFGSYHLEVQALSENKILAIRNIEIRPVDVEAKRYQEVRKFYQDMAKADASQFVLVKQN